MFNLMNLKSPKNPCLKRFLSSNSEGELTALYQFHVENGGKIVNFGGYKLPVNYSDLSIINSHLHTRKSASLFDVSHMLQTKIRGKDCVEYFETITTADVKNQPNGVSTLTVFTDEKGGILDDLIVTKCSEHELYVVSNAGRKHHDIKLMKNALVKFVKQKTNADVSLSCLEPSEQSLLALQGPKAAETLQKVTNINLETLFFMNSCLGEVGGVKDTRITRCGYTGEDGFEISMPSVNAIDIAKLLFGYEDVKLGGLGARDSLRLEAGLCLYGSDITDKITPVEAGLTWLVAKRRREMQDFPGAEKILKQIKEGTDVKRIGLVSLSGPPARQGTKILSEDKEIGIVTSGCPSPSTGTNIAMGYVQKDFAKNGSKLSLKIREKFYNADVTKMPFVTPNYYNKPK